MDNMGSRPYDSRRTTALSEVGDSDQILIQTEHGLLGHIEEYKINLILIIFLIIIQKLITQLRYKMILSHLLLLL